MGECKKLGMVYFVISNCIMELLNIFIRLGKVGV